MSELTPPPSESPDASVGSDGPGVESVSIARKKPRTLMVAACVVGGLVVAAAVTLTVVNLTQPTSIERAGEACAGSKPLQALLDSSDSTSTPTPQSSSDSGDDDEYAELFEGVVSVEDDGKTLIVNTKPQDDDVLALTALSLDCVYEHLNVPTYISERIGQTRALDGRQDGDWGDYTASWGYHPDSGANLIIVHK